MNNEWKPEKNISSPWDVDVRENNIGQPIRDFAGYQLTIPKLSNWTCYLFGGSPGNGIQYTPIEGKVPNRFVRWMMKLCFACTWVKNNETQS